MSNLRTLLVLVVSIAACEPAAGTPRPTKQAGPTTPETLPEEVMIEPSEIGQQWMMGRSAAAAAPAPLPQPPASEPPSQETPSQPEPQPTPNATSEAAGAPPAPEGTPGLELDGHAIQGGMIRAKLNGGELKKMTFPGHQVRVGEDGKFLIAFSRDAKPSEKLGITLADGSLVEQVFEVEQREYATERIDGLPDEEVDLDPKTRATVQKLDAAIEKARMIFSPKTCYEERFDWPVRGRISSHYGIKRVLNGKDAGNHWGVDIAANIGTPVRSPVCGTVVYAEEDVPLAGNLVIVDHGHGLTSSFLHLSKIGVKVGDEIEKGAVLGNVGKTGRVTGAHLDWRMNVLGTRIDPELLVAPMR